MATSAKLARYLDILDCAFPFSDLPLWKTRRKK